MAKKESLYKLKTCEMHTSGEPVRIIENIEPPIIYNENSTVLDKKRFLSERYDFIRTIAILEPRGHKDMFGVILTSPNENSKSDFGVIFLNNQGYASMCGHVTIALGRYLIEKKLVKPIIPKTEIKLDCPCGLVKVFVDWDGQTVGKTKFLSVPAFLMYMDYEIFVPELKNNVVCDISFGGNFYVIVSDKKLGVDFNKDSPAKIVDHAFFLFEILKKKKILHHPTNKELEQLYGIIVTDDIVTNEVCNTLCVFGIKAFDRSPCGSGTTALVASQYFRGNLTLNQSKVTQNPFLGKSSQFIGSPKNEVIVNETKCVEVEIIGRSYFTGENIMTYEEDDELKFGFNI